MIQTSVAVKKRDAERNGVEVKVKVDVVGRGEQGAG